MAQYRYQAVNRRGQSITGQIEAEDLNKAVEELRKQGLYPMKVKSSAGKGFLTNEIHLAFMSQRRVNLQDIVPFCRQFATMIRAGVSVTRSLEILVSQTNNRSLKKALEEVHKGVRQGMSLQEAFAVHPKVFPELFVNMVGAGEYAGQLETMLERMAVYFERQRTTSQKMVSALTYPAVVFLIAIVVSIFLLVSVVPTITQAFTQQGMELPLPTRVVIWISNCLIDYWYLAMALVIALVAGGYGVLKSQRGRLVWDKFLLRIPIIGNFYKKVVMARFTRTFSILEASAVPILDALELLNKIVGNRWFDQVMEEAQLKLRKGERLSAILEKYPVLIPPMVAQMVAVGEETGELGGLMEKMADFYETEVTEMSARLSSLLEPLMIVFLAGMVGTIILSIYLPMFSMINFTK